MSERYKNSEEMLARAEKSIPLGSQTFSKSRTQYPFGVSPYFVQRAKGSKCWDVDGNEYTDFVNGLCSVTLGYSDADVTQAVEKQLQDGVIFSLPHPIEHRVAEKLIEMVPCAESVRFGKNGSDATSGAIRVSRAFTRRDRVAVCGYHGWQDWYIGSTVRNLGVPACVGELTHSFKYNDLDSLHALFKKYPGEIACVIMEPMNVMKPNPGFLEGVQELARKNGALLVFDEMITGFRYANGGAQQYFGITPDLATFGKGLANGYPVAAVAGRRDVMKMMEEVFFSFTFGGETLSLAAAEATMTKLQKQPVIERTTAQGEKILTFVRQLIQKHQIEDIADIAGHPTWSFLILKDAAPYTSWQLKTLFLQEVFSRGVLTVGTHNLSFAHSDEDLAKLHSVYDEVFPILRTAVRDKALDKLLKCAPLEPLFKLR
jgi:glutamate-1-semialdehyde 2,1-aminomutase